MVLALAARIANRDLTALDHVWDVGQSLLMHRRALLFSEEKKED